MTSAATKTNTDCLIPKFEVLFFNFGSFGFYAGIHYLHNICNGENYFQWFYPVGNPDIGDITTTTSYLQPNESSGFTGIDPNSLFSIPVSTGTVNASSSSGPIISGNLESPFWGGNQTPQIDYIDHFWEDANNEPSFPDYDPSVDGPRDINGFRRKGSPYSFIGGSIQNYTDDNGHIEAVFTQIGGSQITFPGVTITNFAVINNRGYTTAWGSIHLGNSSDLADIEHEYGHYLQSQFYGTSAYNSIIVPYSILSASISAINHKYSWTEMDANKFAVDYFGVGSAIALSPQRYPR